MQMRLSMHLILVMLIASLSTSSCTLIGGVDRVAEIQKKLQSKEWNLTRVTSNGNDLEFTPQSLNFISETEVEYTYQPNGTTTSVTETHPFEIISSVSSYNIDFIIKIPNLSFTLDVISIADGIMTSGYYNNSSFPYYVLSEYK
jgi:hypothetical protein